ncbi:hypothetical protein GCM10009565_00070 [Amycolatopsis albidoflavus]
MNLPCEEPRLSAVAQLAEDARLVVCNRPPKPSDAGPPGDVRVALPDRMLPVARVSE